MRRKEQIEVIQGIQVQTDVKPKMVKSRTGWVVKGLMYTSLLGLGVAMTMPMSQVQAAEWTPNTATAISARISEGDNSYTFVQGDTFYEIGQAINVKFDVLMSLNGFELGSQYSVPVGTTISFDGNQVTVTDKEGNVTNRQTLTDDAKVDATKPFMKQPSTTKPVITTPTGTNSNNNGGQVNPVNPTTPNPQPDEGLTVEEQIELLKIKLGDKYAELETAQKGLDNAKIIFQAFEEEAKLAHEEYMEVVLEMDAIYEIIDTINAPVIKLHEEAIELQDEIADIELEIEWAKELEEDTTILEAQKVTLEKELAKINDEIERLNELLEPELEPHLEELEIIEIKYLEKQKTWFEAEKDKNKAQEEVAYYQAWVTRVEKEIAELEKQIAVLEGKPVETKPTEPTTPVEPEEEPEEPVIPEDGDEEIEVEEPGEEEIEEPGEVEETPEPEEPSEPETLPEIEEEVAPELSEEITSEI